MPSPQRIIDTVVLSTLGLWLLRSLRWLGNPTLMRHGFIEVRVRGGEIDVTCRTRAKYQYHGFFNPNTTGWIISFRPSRDDRRDETGRSWCDVVLETQEQPKTGATFRVGDPPDSKAGLTAVILNARLPYDAFARAGVMHVEDANRSHVRGTFQLTLEHLAREPAVPPLTVEGRFEVSRNPIAER